MKLEGWVRGPWGIGGAAVVLAVALVGIGFLRGPGSLDVFLEPAGAEGIDPFLVLDGDPDLRLGAAGLLSISNVDVRVGIEPGLYGGSGSDHLCDPKLIADFLGRDQAKAAAWAGAAGIEVAEIGSFLESLTPVRLRADTWVTNHGFRDGQATPRQSILQAGTMVLIDDLGVPRVRCKCGNPLLEPRLPDDRDEVKFVGDPWDDFDPKQFLVIQAGAEAVSGFVLLRLEDGRKIARPVGTTGDQDVLIDDDGNWIPELDILLPFSAAVGEGPFTLPPINSAGIEVEYATEGPCRSSDGELVLTGEGRCVVSVSSAASEPWAALDLHYEIGVGLLTQVIQVAPFDHLVVGEDPIELGAVADSGLPVTYSAEGPCTIDGTTLVGTGAGTCELTLIQTGDARFAAAEPVTISIEIVDGDPRDPAVLVMDLPSSLRLSDDPVPLSAESTPDRPVVFFATGGCEITPDGGNLRPTAVGSCEVMASAVDDDQVQRAVTVQTIEIRQQVQTISLEDLPLSAVASQVAFPLPSMSSADMGVSYEASGACRLVEDGLLLDGAGRCDLVGSADGDAQTEPVVERRQIDVTAPPEGEVASAVPSLAAQTITFGQPADLVFGGGGVALAASASSGLPVSLTVTGGTCEIDGATLNPVGAGRCTVTAAQRGNDTFRAAPLVSRVVNVARISPTIDITILGGPADEIIGGDSRTIQAEVSAGPPATITQTAGPCVLTDEDTVEASSTAAGDCVITVAAPGDANHDPISVPATITVRLTQSIDLAVGDTTLFESQDTTVTATATSGLDVVISVGPAGVCVLGAAGIDTVGDGTCTVTATQGGNGAFLPAPSRTETIAVAARRVPVLDINAPPALVVDDAFDVDVTSTEAGVPITVTVGGGGCDFLTSAEDKILATASGTCTVTANQAATVQTVAASAQVSIPVAGKIDAISFECETSPCIVAVDDTILVGISTQSLLPIDTLSGEGSCTFDFSPPTAGTGVSTVTGDSVGPCTVTATTAGNSSWQPISAMFTITANPIVGTIDFDLPATALADDTIDFVVNHNIPFGIVDVDVDTSDPCSASVDDDAGLLTTTAPGTCTVTITVDAPNYTSASHTESVNITLRPSTISFDLPDALSAGSEVQFDINHNIPSFAADLVVIAAGSCTVSDSSLSPILETTGAGPCTVTATVSGTYYEKSSHTERINVSLRPTWVRFDPPTSMDLYGKVQVGVGHNIQSSPVTFGLTNSGPCTVARNGLQVSLSTDGQEGTCSITLAVSAPFHHPVTLTRSVDVGYEGGGPTTTPTTGGSEDITVQNPPGCGELSCSPSPGPLTSPGAVTTTPTTTPTPTTLQ